VHDCVLRQILLEIGHAARGVPDSQDVKDVSLVVYHIDDAVWPQDDLPDGLVGFFWNDSIGEGQFGGSLDVLEDAIRKAGGRSRIVLGDERNDLPEIVNGGLGPDYLVSHRLRLSLTSS